MVKFGEIFGVVTHLAADTIANHGKMPPCFVFAVPEEEENIHLHIVETEIADMTAETDNLIKTFMDFQPVAAFHVFEDVSEEKGRVLIIFGCCGDSKRSTITPFEKQEDGVIKFSYPLDVNGFDHEILDKFDFKVDK